MNVADYMSYSTELFRGLFLIGDSHLQGGGDRFVNCTYLFFVGFFFAFFSLFFFFFFCFLFLKFAMKMKEFCLKGG